MHRGTERQDKRGTLTEHLDAVVGAVGDEHAVLARHVHVVGLVELAAVRAQPPEGAQELARQVEHADPLSSRIQGALVGY